MVSTILPSCSPGLEALMRRADLGEREDGVDHRLRAARGDEVVDGLEVLVRAHRRAVDRQLLPPHAVQVRGRIRARSSRRKRRPAGRPRHQSDVAQVSAPTVSTTTWAPPSGELLHAGGDVLVAWFTVASAPSSRARASFSSDDDVTTACAPERLRDRERRGRDAAADPPDQHPLAGCSAAFVTSIRQAVSKTSGKAAASSNESESGMG